jgi:peptidoglycan/LPS O-acetylase OafA/YrhL
MRGTRATSTTGTGVDAALGEVPPGTPAPLRQRTVHAVVAVVGACWLLLTSFVLPLPHTESGVDARQRTMAFGLGLALVAVGWLRRGHRRVLPFVLAYALLALALAGQSFVLGYGGQGPLAVAWWNDKVAGVLMLVHCAGAAVAAHRPGRRPAARRP